MKSTCLVIMVCLLLAVAGQTPARALSPQADAGFGGPGSVTDTLNMDRETKLDEPLRKSILYRYFDFKKKVEDTYGFRFGFDYYALLQAVTRSPGEDTAAGGVFRAFGNWTILGRDSGNTGSLVYKVENRHRLGTDIAPKGLGFEAGYAGLTAVTFSDIGWALTNLYWSQHLWGNRLGFVAGLVDVADYIDIYGLTNVWTDFNNYAFTTNPTIPAPSQGLGAAARFMATDHLYVLGGIADANGAPTAPGDVFDSFFNDNEYFTHLEVGWISSWARRYNDNIHITIWHADEREQAGVNDGWGVAFSFSRLLDDTWEPFFRAGYADDGGALWQGSVSAGLGYHLPNQTDLLGVGLNWSRPSEDTLGPGLDDQYTAEAFYRFQALKVLTITPDAQLLVNPAMDPDQDLILAFGLRVRISF